MNNFNDRSDYPEDFDTHYDEIDDRDEALADSWKNDENWVGGKQLNMVCCAQTTMVYNNRKEHLAKLQDIMNRDKFKKIFSGLMG